ncbi:MAG: hypothetical protein GWN67_21140 [Phycisphaerae bacterium]|nr:hypothetical protein [Phycisphaerae bacterium]NIQ75406.1 hypothetical protein [Gammaproteobacteria bacterium]NIS53444.1 hypothetical protein [Phycisphaerae bacterium]NIU58792.1 hypothetical protein [Phycisphaerae bacterium]NIW95065.1 hypothetical protein [Phycisphaerae bacterium]
MKSTKIFTILVLGLMVCCQQVVFAGTITGWGDNGLGKATPPSGGDYVAIAAGGHHGLALKADGSIAGWGWDSDGQATPPAGNDYVSIGIGLAHSVALKANGSIVGWGLNSNGQATPPVGSDYVAIAAGGWHSLALKNDGSIVGWGFNGYGQATPPAGNDYMAIDAEGRHSLALKTDGSIIVWGISNEGVYDFGQVTDAPTDSNYVAIAAGWYHNIALKNDGSIVAWGISDGSADDYGQVTDTPTGNGFVTITAGHWHNLALKEDGTIVGWGRDNYNQTTPPAGKDFVAISAGGDFSLVLTESAIGTGFIYQGRLIDADYPADDNYDFRFELYNDMTAGMQQGTTIYRDDVGVSDGYFTTDLDFGTGVFDSNALWLEISVRPDDVNDPNLYTRLSPRQRITPIPYAVHASSSDTVQTPLELSGSIAAPNSILHVQNHHSTGIAISGTNTSSGYYGYLGTNTEGVHGWGGLAGVMGQSSSGRGLWGTSISGEGIYAEQFNSGNYGILGSSLDGVLGLSNSSSGSGVAGIHNGNGNGIYGRSSTGLAGHFSGDVYVSENLGIGTLSPEKVLHVKNKSNTEHFQIKIANPNGGGNKSAHAGILFHVEDDQPNRGKGGIMYESIGNWNRGNLHFLQNNNQNDSQAALADSVMTIQNNGNVGIGTTDPNSKLHVIDDSVDNNFETAGYFETVAHSSRAVTGVASSTVAGACYGGHFTAASLEGRGVYGEASNTLSTTNYGGYFKALGEKGRGVYGEATYSGSGINYGGYFKTNTNSGRGVYGLATDPTGVNFGVYGETYSSNGYAGYFLGRVRVSGTLSKAAGSFKIDHPLDPENKYLQHSFVESPDMMNVYNGNAVLDENGEAVAELPDYFEALNRDFRYQLTCIGGFAPVYVAEEISENQFRISGGKRGMKVSWQVTGIRKDSYAKANRIVVEEDKAVEARGYYLHPEVYGYGKEKSIDAVRNTQVSETRRVAIKTD